MIMLLIVAGLADAFILDYRLYGRRLGRRLFRLAYEAACLADQISMTSTSQP
jgi:hypothetical protein